MHQIKLFARRKFYDERGQEFFSQLNSANRYAILHGVVTDRKPETRQRRIEKFIALLKAGEKLYP